MQHNHGYLKVFAKEGLGFEKWVLLLELLSNLTANMFLLALVRLLTQGKKYINIYIVGLIKRCIFISLSSSTTFSTLKTMDLANSIRLIEVRMASLS